MLADDQQTAMDVINRATHPELAWAAGRMLGIVYSLASQVAGGDMAHARRLMASAFEGDGDLVDTQLRVLTLGEDGNSTS